MGAGRRAAWDGAVGAPARGLSGCGSMLDGLADAGRGRGGAGAASRVALSAGACRARRWCFPRISARIRTTAPSGGTSPAGCATRPGSSAASSSPSSACARASARTTRAASRRASSCSRTPRWPIPRPGRLRHAERSGRAYPGLVEALEGRTAVRVDDWFLEGGDSSHAGLPQPHRGGGLRLRPRFHARPRAGAQWHAKATARRRPIRSTPATTTAARSSR